MGLLFATSGVGPLWPLELTESFERGCSESLEYVTNKLAATLFNIIDYQEVF